jgi:hypothetical protein
MIDSRTWRPSLWLRVPCWIVIIGLLLETPLLILLPGGRSGGWWWGGPLLEVIFGLVAWLLYRLSQVPYIRATSSAIEIRNPFSRHSIPWTDIEGATPGYYGLRIRTRSGKSVVAVAGQKPNWAAWTKTRTQADEIAEYVVAHSTRTFLRSQ